MPSPQVLQPVLKMKVDEVFLNWLSEPNTQAQLNDYLTKIKNGESIEMGSGDCRDNSASSLLGENSPGNRSVSEKASTSGSTNSNPPSTALPSGSSGLARVGANGSRALRRSVSSKKVRLLASVSGMHGAAAKVTRYVNMSMYDVTVADICGNN